MLPITSIAFSVQKNAVPTSNHDHLLIGLLPGLTLAEVVQKLKANASRRLGENGVQFKRPKGYGALSASPFFPQRSKPVFIIGRNITRREALGKSFWRFSSKEVWGGLRHRTAIYSLTWLLLPHFS